VAGDIFSGDVQNGTTVSIRRRESRREAVRVFDLSRCLPNMDLSVSPAHGKQENSVWNGHYARTCYRSDIRAKKSRYRLTRYSLSSYSSTSAFFRADRKPWRKNEGLFYAHHRDGDNVASL
jgi:hypothetical protein